MNETNGCLALSIFAIGYVCFVLVIKFVIPTKGRPKEKKI